MSSFLFEKEQVNCSCFQNTSQNLKRIFRSNSQQEPNSQPKELYDTPLKFQTPNAKMKKKSLKKQKPNDSSLSPHIQPYQDETSIQTLIPELPLKNDSNPSSLIKFQQLHEYPKPQRIKTERTKPIQPQNIIHFPPSFPSQKLVNPQPSKSHNYTQSHHLIVPNYNEEFDKLVQQEFKRDLNDFKLKMEVRESKKNPEDQKPLKTREKHLSQLPFASNKVFKDFNEFNDFNSTELHFKQIDFSDKLISNRKDSKTQHFHAKQYPLGRIDSLQLIPEHKLTQKSLLGLNQVPVQRQRKESFTTSTILYKDKELQHRKIKHKMDAKEIESQKDGSSSNESDKMSEVVGRGWDGLTEQKIELQELDDLLKRKESNHSETMITQESHIKNSEIKTFTDFSNSFISPKSHKTRIMQTSTAFGGGKYGMVGISYQNMDDLQKVKNSGYGKLHF